MRSEVDLQQFVQVLGVSTLEDVFWILITFEWLAHARVIVHIKNFPYLGWIVRQVVKVLNMAGRVLDAIQSQVVVYDIGRLASEGHNHVEI